MPQPAIGNTDFGADFYRGAQIGNMRAMRQERMMQLRAEEAKDRIQERYMSAQADAIAYKLDSAKKIHELAQKGNVMFHTLMNTGMEGLSPDDTAIAEQKARKTVNNWMFNQDPESATEIFKGMAEMAKAEGQGTPADVERRRHNLVMEGQGGGEGFMPEIVPVKNPEGGTIPVLRTGKNTSQMLEAKPKTDDVGQAYSLWQAAKASGNEQLAKFHEAHLAKMTQSTGTTIKTNADGTVEIVQGGPVGGPDALTKQNQTKAQEGQAMSLSAIDAANRLEPLISSETVGPRAFAESWVNDRILANYFPELASSKRASAATLVGQLKADAVKSLGTPPISDKERAEILKAVPSINEPLNSPQNVKNMLVGVRKISAMRAIVAAKRLGTSVPVSAAKALTLPDLESMYEQGLITSPMAVEAGKIIRGMKEGE